MKCVHVIIHEAVILEAYDELICWSAAEKGTLG